MEIKLAVVRDSFSMPGATASVYSHSSKLRVRLIGRYDHSMVEFAQRNPRITLVSPRRRVVFPGFIPWIYFQGLEEVVKDVAIIETLETWSYLSRQCAKICKRTGKLLVTYVYETIENHVFNYIPLYHRNTNIVIENTAAFIAPTQLTKERYLKALSVPEEKIRVIYYSTDTGKFFPPKEREPPLIPRILFVGALIPTKGVPELLESFRKLCDSGVLAELWVCGKGKLEPMVRNYCERYPVKYFGFVSYEKIPSVYRQCDIFCLPSRDLRMLGFKIWEEQFGNVLIEAMASGLPVVATDCGSISEIVGTENVVVPQGSVRDLRLALEALIRDENRRHKLGASNRRRALELFSDETQHKKYENMLIDLVETFKVE